MSTTEQKPGEQVVRKIELPASNSVWKKDDKDIINRLAISLPLDESRKDVVQYWLFLPKNYDANAEKTWPLLLFLHGAGERGDNIDLVTVHGPAKRLKEQSVRDNCPFIVVSPQCHEERYWAPKQLLLLLDELEKELKVDKERIYVTGLSMGGFASWMLAAEASDRFAAVAPVCGGFQIAQAAKLVDVPIWAFHGMKDPVVPFNLSTDMVSAIEIAGGKKIRLTLYPEADHDSWTETYNKEELYRWLLSHKKVD